MMVIACEGGHTKILLQLVKLSGATDFEGPDGLNALTLALGQLDPDLVNVLANSKVGQPKAPEFLCDIVDELDREISGQKSDSKRKNMESLRSVIVEQKIHERLCERPSCSKTSTPSVDEK